MDIYVGNLPFSATEEEVAEFFADFGPVERVKIITDRETGRPRGFCFVTLADASKVDEAVEALNEQEFGGRNLKVKKAEPREPRPPGGFGGGGERRAGGPGGDRRGGGPGGDRRGGGPDRRGGGGGERRGGGGDRRGGGGGERRRTDWGDDGGGRGRGGHGGGRKGGFEEDSW